MIKTIIVIIKQGHRMNIRNIECMLYSTKKKLNIGLFQEKMSFILMSKRVKMEKSPISLVFIIYLHCVYKVKSTNN